MAIDTRHRVQLAKHIVQAVARKHKECVIKAALRICEQAVREGNGGAANIIIAAAVDLTEEGSVPG